MIEILKYLQGLFKPSILFTIFSISNSQRISSAFWQGDFALRQGEKRRRCPSIGEAFQRSIRAKEPAINRE
ncbi:MAG: hypothetical protein AAF705_19605, partial [Bacteroidota bacterium]